MSPRELADGVVRALHAELVPDLSALDAISERIVSAQIPVAGDSRTREQACAWLALELHRYYTALETIFERVAKQLDGRMPDGSGWHKALLAQASLVIDDLRPPLVSREAAIELGALLSFRHFLRHAYAVELDPVRIEAHRLRVERIHPTVRRDLETFKDHLVSMLHAGTSDT